MNEITMKCWTISHWARVWVGIVACSIAACNTAVDPVGEREPAMQSSPLTVTPGAPWVARHGLSAADYQTEFNKWVGLGYRLSSVSGYSVNNQAQYAAIWQQAASSPWVARHGLTAAQYQQEFNTQTANGYHPVLVNGYTVNGVDYYAAIWEKSPTGAWIARHGMTSAQYQQEFDTQVANGYRLLHVSGYGGNSEEFAAIWVQSSGPAWIARHGMTSAQYQQAFDTQVANGYHLVLVGGYPVPGDIHYVAIWEQGPVVPWQARHGLTTSAYQQTFNDLRYQGYRPVVLSGYGVGGSAQFAALFQNYALSGPDLATIDNTVSGVQSSTGAPAISLAITKNGKLVFAKAYGVIDSSNTPANTANLFRIASVSKPITSAAILKLVEQGKLTLDSKVFGTGALLGTTYGTKVYSNWLKQITVRHLLSHTAGGWPNDGNDPMFQDVAWTQTQVINWALDNQPLTNQPGTAYAYSNFGFCLLGRVIEKVTGQTYATWVRQNVLSGVGITDMQIGGNTLSARKTNEVMYFDDFDPYSMNVSRMDSHGGWIATPIDLVRFALRVDGFSPPSDLLSASSETAMNTGSSANSGYGLGWVLTTHNVVDAPCKASAQNPCQVGWHNGSLPGTTSILVRTSGQFTWAAITNTRRNSPDIDTMMWNIIDNVSAWPTSDLF